MKLWDETNPINNGQDSGSLGKAMKMGLGLGKVRKKLGSVVINN